MRRSPQALIYIARCRATGEVYIGCTGRTLAERRVEHTIAAANGSPWKFHEYIRKHGAGSVEWAELERCAHSDMFRLERYYIQKYNSFRSGLNSTPGGAGKAPVGRASAYRPPSRPGTYKRYYQRASRYF